MTSVVALGQMYVHQCHGISKMGKALGKIVWCQINVCLHHFELTCSCKDFKSRMLTESHGDLSDSSMTYCHTAQVV